ncbi:MAG: glycosyltransferase, partial [Niabella sp.]
MKDLISKKEYISGAIVLYNNNPAVVSRAIRSFVEHRRSEILYLIDNSPTDELKSLAAISNKIIYIPSNDNPGFGSAHNKGIKKSLEEGYPYHIILNPDVTFMPAILDELFLFMELNPDIGNVMPNVFYANGELQKLCNLIPTPLNLIVRRFALFPRLSKLINEKYDIEGFLYDRIAEVPNLSGCFMFLRNKILEKTGGFDERFFMYMEDVDLSRRLNEVSKTVFYPHVSITHNFEKGSYANYKLLKYHIFSAIKYFNKWGWFFDANRRKINKETLSRIRNYQSTYK